MFLQDDVVEDGITVLDLTLLGVVEDIAVMLRAVAYRQGCCLGCSKAKLDVNPLLFVLDPATSLTSVTARLLDDVRDDGHDGDDDGCLGILSSMFTFM